MNTLVASAPSASPVVEFARRRPGAALAWVLGLHLVLWTALPILVCSNLQLDLVEDLALGKEWQLGYWKHPPLPWWLADALYRLTGQIDSVYLLGPLVAVLCLYFVWRLAREVVDPIMALAAVLALEGLHFYNFSGVKFAHDQMQLPFWALIGWFVYRAISGAWALDWIAAGAFLGLAFWSKYAAFSLAATIGLILLFDPAARPAWRTRGPYLMAAAFFIVIGPNLWWLVENDFRPFQYVDMRAVEATHWYQFVTFPLRWTISQVFYLVPTIVLIAMLFGGRLPKQSTAALPFARRYVTALALGPFLVTTAIFGVLGRLPVAMWGYPLWSFAPLAFLMWFAPSPDGRALRQFAAAFAIVFVVLPVAYAADELLEPVVRDRQKATHFPGRAMAELVTRRWREVTGTPLRYVGGAPIAGGGGEFAANNVAVYSTDRPHVLVDGDPKLSPWIDMADFDRTGGVLVWQSAQSMPEALRERFPQAQPQPPVVLPPQTLVRRSPAVIQFAIVPPRRMLSPPGQSSGTKPN
jgi:4-amino-4-deoxy-L-arabinose transferase-like glycosyltransferase